MQFAHEWVLLLLFIVPVIGAVWLWLLRRQWRRFELVFDPALRRMFVPPSSWRRLVPQFICLLTALALTVIALARPRWGTVHSTVVEPQHDLIVVLDVSRSMLVRDVIPNRLERAKAMVYDLIQSGANGRIALVAFSGGAQRMCPLTRDTDFLLQTLDGIHIDLAPRGPTDLAQAIRMARDSFVPDRPDSRTVLLISDGEDLAGGLDDALADARRDDVRFITIGIGTVDGAPIPDERSPTGYQKYDGERVITCLVHETLDRIAAETGGIYVPVADGMTDLDIIYRQYKAPATMATRTKEMVQYQTEQYQWFLFAAIVLLLIAAFFSRGRPGAATGRGTMLTPLLFALLLPYGFGGSAQAAPPPSRPARRAIQQYRAGDYRAAAQLFEAAIDRETQPAVRATLLYNAGCARFDAGDYEIAVRHFNEALDHDPDTSPALRHDLAVAELAAARLVLRETVDPERIAGIRQRLHRAITQIDHALHERPQQETWYATRDHLDQTLAQANAMERTLQIIAEYGGLSPFELIDELLQRQRAIRRDLAAADLTPLPQRLRLRQELADRQRMVADLIPILLTAVGDDADKARRANAAALTTRSAVDLIADAGERAAVAVQRAESIIYELWKDLADSDELPEEMFQCLTPPPEEPDPELPEDKPDLPDDAKDIPMPFESPSIVPDIADDPLEIPEPRKIEDISDEELEPDRIGIILDRIRRRERDYLEERRRRAIHPAPEGRDW